MARAEGTFALKEKRVKVVDLPGTYSLQAGSADEEVARDFILFGEPDVTVVVVDATRLERNLNLVLQVLEITDSVVVCLNLMDEAKRHGIAIDPKKLEQELGVPVIPAAVRHGEGIPELLDAIHDVATGNRVTTPFRISEHPASVENAVGSLAEKITEHHPELPNARWVALRLLNADERVEAAVRSGALGKDADVALERAVNQDHAAIASASGAQILAHASKLRWTLPADFHDRLIESVFGAAGRIAQVVEVRGIKKAKFDFDRQLDKWLTSRIFGFPLMLGILAVVFWLTIAGANVPSGMLATLLIDTLHPILQSAAAGLPWWLNGLLIDGVYLSTAWVISVMLPPMAIFFPLFHSAGRFWVPAEGRV